MIESRELEADVSFFQPKLSVKKYRKDFVLSGKFVVSDGASEDGPLAEFDVAIFVPSEFPDIEPTVWETAGKLPKDIDRHTYAETACCTCVWEEWLAQNPAPTFRAYLEGPVYNFFLSQLYFEEFAEWPFGERKHGIDGIVQAASNILDLQELTLDAAITYMRVLSASQLKGHFDCPCGSGSKLRSCHLNKLAELRARLAPEIALKFLRVLSRARTAEMRLAGDENGRL